MSQRLTNSIRDKLQEQLLQRAFKKRAQDLVNRCALFAIRVYEDAFARDLKQIKGLPNGWLGTDTDIKVMMSGQMTVLRFWGTLDECRFGDGFKQAGVDYYKKNDLPFPYKKRGQVCGQYDGTHALAIEYDAIKHEVAELEGEIHRARKTARAAMDAVGTVERLIKIWPEVEEFAKTYLRDGEQKALLPAIPRAELNAALNLPPEEKAA